VFVVVAARHVLGNRTGPETACGDDNSRDDDATKLAAAGGEAYGVLGVVQQAQR